MGLDGKSLAESLLLSGTRLLIFSTRLLSGNKIPQNLADDHVLYYPLATYQFAIEHGQVEIMSFSMNKKERMMDLSISQNANVDQQVTMDISPRNHGYWTYKPSIPDM